MRWPDWHVERFDAGSKIRVIARDALTPGLASGCKSPLRHPDQRTLLLPSMLVRSGCKHEMQALSILVVHRLPCPPCVARPLQPPPRGSKKPRGGAVYRALITATQSAEVLLRAKRVKFHRP